MEVFGNTRSRFTRDHALITPDTHVTSPLLGWQNAEAVVHISPEMGARFFQYTAMLGSDASSGAPANGFQRLIYVREGSVRVEVESKTHTLAAGGFAYLPAHQPHCIVTDAKSSATLIVFEKEFTPLVSGEPSGKLPSAVVGRSADIVGEPFLGDEDAILQTLLPVEPEFDMAVNIFTYQSGATLPQVEIHRMEHGLTMIAGMGVYRLSDDYYPVTEGDVIWMASYCPQWFVAMGKQPASYIYYKDIHR